MNLKKVLILGSLVLLLVAIPLTVFVAQQQQQTETQAQKSTNLCFIETPTTPSATIPTCPSTGPTLSKSAGATFSVDVIMNPGSNQVSTVRLNITYDATKVSIPENGISPNTTSVTPLTETTYGAGTATARLGIVINPSVGVDPTKALSEPSKIATIQFKVADNATVGTTPITFGQTLVLSSNPADGQDEDVLSSAPPLSLNITSGTAGGTPTPTGTAVPTGQAPQCTALNVDRTTSGTAPFSITFTANGRDTDGTISKVTFDFGDGPVQDVTQGGGIGTNAVSAQIAHTYNNAGTFTAKVTLTDNSATVSTASAACTQTITVSNAIGGVATPSATATPSAEVPTPTDTPEVESPGPSDWIFGAGALGIFVSVIGGLLFFSL